MKILIIRHADPDYSIDSLTEKGWKEAELLSARMEKTDITAIYVSPLGRAKDTAKVTLKRLNREAEELPWLREFKAPITDIHTGEQRIPWDWLPLDWTTEPLFYGKDTWHTVPAMANGRVKEEAQKVYDGLDAILKKHGYQRENNYYRVNEPNNDTLIFFCHFGVECIMLGHLLGVSPMILWHGFSAAPSSVTSLLSEERREGIAYFRSNCFGDTSHLYVAGEEPAFSARFCERFDDHSQRHD